MNQDTMTLPPPESASLMMRTDLAGKIRNTRLSPHKPLQPLFETVVNSFDAIFEAAPTRAWPSVPRVVITAVRDAPWGSNLRRYRQFYCRGYPVSTRVNQAANDDEECAKPVEIETHPQGQLFT